MNTILKTGESEGFVGIKSEKEYQGMKKRKDDDDDNEGGSRRTQGRGTAATQLFIGLQAKLVKEEYSRVSFHSSQPGSQEAAEEAALLSKELTGRLQNFRMQDEDDDSLISGEDLPLSTAQRSSSECANYLPDLPGDEETVETATETTSPESEESIHGWTTPTEREEDESSHSTSMSDSEDDDSDGDDGASNPNEAEITEKLAKDEDQTESESEADDAERKSTIVKGAIKPPEDNNEDQIESESEADDDAERKSTIVKGAIKPPEDNNEDQIESESEADDDAERKSTIAKGAEDKSAVEEEHGKIIQEEEFETSEATSGSVPHLISQTSELADVEIEDADLLKCVQDLETEIDSETENRLLAASEEESSEQGKTEVEKTENKIDEVGKHTADETNANKADETHDKVEKTVDHKTENKIDEAGEQAADVTTANKAEEADDKVEKTADQKSMRKEKVPL